MKISQSSVALASQHSLSSRTTVEESLRAWVGSQRPDFDDPARGNGAPSTQARVAISEAARQAAAAAAVSPKTTPPRLAPELPFAQGASGLAGAPRQAASEIDAALEEVQNDPQMKLLIQLIEALTGRQVRLLDAASLRQAGTAQGLPSAGDGAATPAGAPADTPQGWGLEYDRRETVHETEQLAFSARGSIRTADGRTLEFNLALQMKREFYSETSLSVRAGDAVLKDPLVINLDGAAVTLTRAKFDFDLDADGNPDKISFVGPGSGFLAWDKNGNGIIDDGSELFGVQSGNGFADLAAHDQDGNGWIDENDAIFARLLIWSKDADGNDVLGTLAERNIGALYLGHASTPFALKDSGNALQGQVRASGLYLREDGTAGSLQQIDLAV